MFVSHIEGILVLPQASIATKQTHFLSKTPYSSPHGALLRFASALGYYSPLARALALFCLADLLFSRLEREDLGEGVPWAEGAIRWLVDGWLCL